MIWLLPVFLSVLSYLCGYLVRNICGDKADTTGETYLVGMFSLFLLWELLVVPGVLLGLSFRVLVRIYCALLLVICTISLLYGWKTFKSKRFGKWRPTGSFIFALVLFFVQVLLYIFLQPQSGGDYILEEAGTILVSDRIYGYHAGLGTALPVDLSWRYRLTGLGSYYAMLSLICGSRHLADVVYRIMPIWFLILNYVSYGCLFRIFFPELQESEVKRSYCFVLLGLVQIIGVLCGRGIYFEHIHRGYLGQICVYTILIPYILYLSRNFYISNHWYTILYGLMTVMVSAVWEDPYQGTVQLLIVVGLCVSVILGSVIRDRMERRLR